MTGRGQVDALLSDPRNVLALREAWAVPARTAARMTTLDDGTEGCWMVRADDCLGCAIATVLQIPIDRLPDIQLDSRLAAGEDPAKIADEADGIWRAWLADRGLQMVVHTDSLPVDRPRWIGIVPVEGHFASHCLVMRGTELLHDPARKVPDELRERCRRMGLQVRARSWGPADVRIGLTLEPTEPKGK